MNNLALRIVSLTLAFLLWLAIAAEKTSEMGVVVPLELQNLPADLELTGDSVNSVEVRLRASPGVIRRLGPGEVSAQLDLSGVGAGERIVHLTPEAIRVPFGVKVVKISPAILTFSFERTLTRVVPVRPRVLGRPARGFELAEVASEPPEVQVAGPRSRVQEIESAFTEPLSVEGARASITDSVSLGVEDPLLRILGDTRVRVTARIREEHQRRTFNGVSVEVRGGAASVRPATVLVVVEGPAATVARMAASDIRPYVDASGLTASARLPLAFELASGFLGVSVERADPREVLARPTAKGRR
jgi:YbbR domain-containing protein